MADELDGPGAEAPKMDADALRKRAKQVYKSRDFRQAAQLYAQLLAGDPVEPVDAVVADRSGYAAVLINLNKLSDAASELEKAIVLAPDDVRVRQKLAEVLSRAGRHNEAVEQFTECVRLEPDVAEPHWRLALELRGLGREADAAAEIDACLKIDPNHTEAQLLQMDDLVMASPERDGQFELERDDDADDGSPAQEPEEPSLFTRHPRALMVLEALALFAIALWIRSLYP